MVSFSLTALSQPKSVQTGFEHVGILTVENYYHLKRAPALIIYNPEKHITRQETLYILAAMLWDKPVVMTHPPKFSKDNILFFRQIIDKHFNKIHLGNLFLLDDVDRAQFLSSITNINVRYSLTKHERTLIRSYIRALQEN